MKKHNLKTFILKKHTETKDSEGSSTSSYGEGTTDKAIIWPATSQLQAMEYGAKINQIFNMNYYGSLDIQPLDMVVYQDEEHKVISVVNYRDFKKIEIEKL